MIAREVDMISLRNNLNIFEMRFDQGMLEGELFNNLKKIYMEIKETQCHLKVMEWDSEKELTRSEYYKGHGHIKEQKPLL